VTAAATALEATAAAGQHHGHFPGSRLPGWAGADRRSIPDADVQRGPLRSVTAIPSEHARPGTAHSGGSGCRARCRASSSTCRYQRDERLRLALRAVGDRHPCRGARSSVRSEPAQVTSPVGPMIRRAPAIIYTYIYYYIYCTPTASCTTQSMDPVIRLARRGMPQVAIILSTGRRQSRVTARCLRHGVRGAAGILRWRRGYTGRATQMGSAHTW
jgi:hypothetical protein